MHRGYIYAKIPQLPSFYKYLYPEICRCPEKLRDWIAELPDLRRTVFNLYCIDGYSHKEIGEMLGISETGSSSILAKARKQLKGMINEYLKGQER